MCWSLLQNQQDSMIGLHTTREHWTQWVPDSHVFVSAEDNVAPQVSKPYQLACEIFSPDCLALNRTSCILRRNQSQTEFLMSQNSRRNQHFISTEMNIHMKFHIFFHLISVKCHHMPIDNTSNIFTNAAHDVRVLHQHYAYNQEWYN